MDDKELSSMFASFDDEELEFTKQDREKVFSKLKKQKHDKPSFFRLHIGKVLTASVLFIMFISFLTPLLSFDQENELASKNRDGFSILLMGKDPGNRTEVNILASYNQNSESIKLVSIPRDSYVSIVDAEGDMIIKDKLAHAYAYGGGPEAVMTTVSKLLRVPIDYYAVVETQGFVEIIDSLGGIDYEHEGNNHLDGEKVFDLLRERESISDGEIGREKRQVNVLQAVIRKLKEHETTSEINAASEHITSNLSFKKMKALVEDGNEKKFETFHLSEGMTEEFIDGVYYGKLDNTVLKQVSKELNDHLR